ncbi:MAG: DRTGG domain-containing protein [Bacteroidales bacterium]
MQIKEIAHILDAEILTGDEAILSTEVKYAFATDMLSDLLKIDKNKTLLITGLATVQTIRAAVVMDVGVILLVRGKKALPEMIELARQNQIVLMEYKGSMFKASGILYQAGIRPVY